MCGYCEDGISQQEYHQILAYRTISRVFSSTPYMMDAACRLLWEQYPYYRPQVLATLAKADELYLKEYEDLTKRLDGANKILESYGLEPITAPEQRSKHLQEVGF